MAEEWVHPDSRNLAADLKEEELSEIASTCLEDFRRDEESRTEWMSMHADWLRLYFQKDHPLNPPWEGASEESLPLLAEACNQFHARAYPAMFPNRKIVKGIPTGRPDPESKARADRISTHMSWQLMVRDTSYKKNKDRLLLSVPLHGSFFTKTYYNPLLKRNIVDNVRAVDLVVAYGTGPRDLEDIERKTHIIPMSVNMSRILEKNGYFIDEAVAYEIEERSDLDAAQDEVMGLEEPGYGDKTMAKVIEQHRLLDLDDDGIEEPYIVTVDVESEKVLRIAIRYETDELGNPAGKNWYDLKEPVEYFTHYTFLENPDGFYGLGYGHLIGQLNIASNKLLRQSVDAGTLANVGNHSGFISEQLAQQGGEMAMQLGKFTKIRGTSEDINRGIYTFKFPGPNASLLQIMDLLMGRSDRLAMVTEALTGQTEKVMQPTAIMSLIEQGLQVFSAAFERIVNAQTGEYQKIYRLNRKFMDPEEYFTVLDENGEMKDLQAARKDYEQDYQVMPTADPRQITKQQKLAKAQAEYQTGMQNPIIASSPHHLYNLTRRFFEAIESENIGEILPTPSNNLPRTDDPTQEDMGAMMDTPMVPMVFPDQDHKAHIQEHQLAMSNPRIGQAGYYALADHIQQHLRYMGYGGTGPAVMAPNGGNQMGAEGIGGAFPGQQGPDMADNGVVGQSVSPQGPVGSDGIPGGPAQ